ncbi:unnamed protein product [Calypogeia fissa]
MIICLHRGASTKDNNLPSYGQTPATATTTTTTARCWPAGPTDDQTTLDDFALPFPTSKRKRASKLHHTTGEAKSSLQPEQQPAAGLDLLSSTSTKIGRKELMTKNTTINKQAGDPEMLTFKAPVTRPDGGDDQSINPSISQSKSQSLISEMWQQRQQEYGMASIRQLLQTTNQRLLRIMGRDYCCC